MNDEALNAPDPGMNAPALLADIQRHFQLTLGQDSLENNREYLYEALALAIRDRLVSRWKRSSRRYEAPKTRNVTYLSMEYLLGRALTNAIHSLNLDATSRQALHTLGVQLEELADQELDAGLGNGGLGRLAACFLDSCASLELPVTGHGLRYEYGMFHQAIVDGAQVEQPDHWLRDGNPWEMERPEYTRRIRFYGRTQTSRVAGGKGKKQWIDTRDVLAIPYDMPIPGYQNDTVNTLRLWKSVATDEIDLAEFNAGDYSEAVQAKNAAEQITMVLYPNDASENGKQLRLQQHYFLASACLQDVVARWVARHGTDFDTFAAQHVFQLNDTHPSCAVPELMRILMDDYDVEWGRAWAITTATMAYTNHTLLPEALERWSVPLFSTLLPRLMEIVYEINARFLQQVSLRWPGDTQRLARMSLIEDGPVAHVRMAYLAVVGSFSVNGVAELHSRLLTTALFNDFHELWPERFNNKTNGVSQRRWLAHCNPLLSAHISAAIGEGWKRDFAEIQALATFAGDAAFREEWRAIRLANKERLAKFVAARTGIRLENGRMLDVQVKRIHEYKRQLLNVLRLIHLYERIRRGETGGLTPRSVLLGGKAAPGYTQAKLIVKLACAVAGAINRDPRVREWLSVVFLPDYGVTSMEFICPATDLSEQISTAGKEASGTGNMKFMMNGALTIGTHDGANIEIRERVGAENFFLFGLTADEVAARRKGYDPVRLIRGDAALAGVMALIAKDFFSGSEPGVFRPIIDSIENPRDPWMVAADFRDYIETQERVDREYLDCDLWLKKSILNTAASGWFSSDRTIGEYARSIWRLPSG